MKTQDELEHQAEKQIRHDEINAGVEWPDDVTRNSGDGGESYSEWLKERDEEERLLNAVDDEHRNRLQSKRDAEEKEWYENERSRAATADYEYTIEEEKD